MFIYNSIKKAIKRKGGGGGRKQDEADEPRRLRGRASAIGLDERAAAHSMPPLRPLYDLTAVQGAYAEHKWRPRLARTSRTRGV